MKKLGAIQNAVNQVSNDVNNSAKQVSNDVNNAAKQLSNNVNNAIEKHNKDVNNANSKIYTPSKTQKMATAAAISDYTASENSKYEAESATISATALANYKPAPLPPKSTIQLIPLPKNIKGNFVVTNNNNILSNVLKVENQPISSDHFYDYNGIYISSASSSSKNNPSSNAFDNNNPTTVWQCAKYPIGNEKYTYPYSNISNRLINTYKGGGKANNIFTTKVNFKKVIDISGEWLQIELPNQVYLYSYTITCPSPAGTNCLFPQSFMVVGTNDGVSWYMVDQQIMQPTEVVSTASFNLNSLKPYVSFRLIIRSLFNGTNLVNINNWSLQGTKNPIANFNYINNTGYDGNAIIDTFSNINSFNYSPFDYSTINFSNYNISKILQPLFMQQEIEDIDFNNKINNEINNNYKIILPSLATFLLLIALYNLYQKQK